MEFSRPAPDDEGIITVTLLEDSATEDMSEYARQTILESGDIIGTLAEYLEQPRDAVAEAVEQYFGWMLEQLAAGHILKLCGTGTQILYFTLNRDKGCYQQIFGCLPEDMALVEIRYDDHLKVAPDTMRIFPLGRNLLTW